MSDVYRGKPIVKTATFWDIVLLILRVWFGYVMMSSGRAFFELFTSNGERKLLEDWFIGHDLRFPLPLIMVFEAKAAEFLGGLFVFSGLFTRFGASLVAFTILVSTLTAGFNANQGVDTTLTVSFCLFAIVLIYWGGGRYAMDSLIKKG